MNCCILGAGAWGTAMALHLDRCGHAVTLVPRRIEQALALASTRENAEYLPGYKLPHTIQIGCEIGPVLMEAEAVFFACPSKAIRPLAEQVRPFLKDAWQLKLTLVMCKGLEADTFSTPSDVLEACLPNVACGVLSGPTFAGDIAAGKPAAAVLAVPQGFASGGSYQEAFSNEDLRCYLSGDVRGTALGGTLKNIYAIGAGMCDGLALGDNAKAALVTRSLHEMVRIGSLLGGQRETFYGLSGFGDLMATCSGVWSRNRNFGEQIGRGSAPESIIENQKTVVEGYWATDCLHRLCREKQVEAPILNVLFSVLYEELAPAAAIGELMNRELRPE
jgi:glycerol-3-phosphate dehydrogenase (NAD(P)+)